MSYDLPEALFKVLIVGDQSTGKTCLIRRYVDNLFQPQSRATLGVDFCIKLIPGSSPPITLQLWDIAGQERYGQMTRVYYQAACGALVVYDVTSPPSFSAVEKWKKDIDSKVQLPDGSGIPCVLVAHKCDLEPDPPRSEAELDGFCKANGFVGWCNVSSKEDINVERCFRMLVDRVVDNDSRLYPAPSSDAFRLSHNEDNEGKSKSKKCCG